VRLLPQLYDQRAVEERITARMASLNRAVEALGAER
jgi:hypothetical protein